MNTEEITGRTFLSGYPIPNQKSALIPDYCSIDRLAIASAVFQHQIHEIGFGSDKKSMKKYLLQIDGVGRFMNPNSGSTWLTVWGTYMPSDEVKNPAYRITQTENLNASIYMLNWQNHFTGFCDDFDNKFIFRINLEAQEREI